jgi:wyosine [tRNA(Phe)-imidazoG37] synthetase (radical SAM superfamily)
LLLQTFNVYNIVQFLTRITENNSSLIDSIFIDNIRRNSYDVVLITNGLSDHDAQCLVLKNINNLHKHKDFGTSIRIINKDSLAQFQNKIFNENWENIYHEMKLMKHIIYF